MRSSARRGHHGARWDQVRLAALERDGWRCQTCGKAGVLEVHHVVALRDGGAPYDLANLVTLCRACHLEAHHGRVSPAEAAWRAFLEEPI